MSEERAAVENLYARYVHGVDQPDFGMLEACFTEDAVYEVEGVYRETGRSSIMKRIRARHIRGAVHLTANIMISPKTPNNIGGVASFVVVGAAGDVTAFGTYHDRIEARDGDWYFAHRRVLYTFTRGAQAVVAPPIRLGGIES